MASHWMDLQLGKDHGPLIERSATDPPALSLRLSYKYCKMTCRYCVSNPNVARHRSDPRRLFGANGPAQSYLWRYLAHCRFRGHVRELFGYREFLFTDHFSFGLHVSQTDFDHVVMIPDPQRELRDVIEENMVVEISAVCLYGHSFVVDPLVYSPFNFRAEIKSQEGRKWKFAKGEIENGMKVEIVCGTKIIIECAIEIGLRMSSEIRIANRIEIESGNRNGMYLYRDRIGNQRRKCDPESRTG
ncbi:hypothetical protein EVAR_64319_1 [Eumeta japonica]|uniref:Uncharacterized protein n=1 Tax=Eumeta variegata TaxID=151549 RepID=A0A4C2AAF2_EUMVA|nr:hypothetical protein EVAR_64319_1 [Eumeta japonica]